MAKGNRAERYGVEHKLDQRGFEPGGADDLITYVEIQECYHTRLFIRVLRLVGLDCDVPFLSDQPFWGHHVARIGVGPSPIPIGELDANRLAEALVQMGTPQIARRAKEIGTLTRAEEGAEAVERLARSAPSAERAAGSSSSQAPSHARAD